MNTRTLIQRRCHRLGFTLTFASFLRGRRAGGHLGWVGLGNRNDQYDH